MVCKININPILSGCFININVILIIIDAIINNVIISSVGSLIKILILGINDESILLADSFKD